MEILRVLLVVFIIVNILALVFYTVSFIWDQLRIKRFNKLMEKLLEDDLRVSEELKKRLEKELGNLDKDLYERRSD